MIVEPSIWLPGVCAVNGTGIAYRVLDDNSIAEYSFPLNHAVFYDLATDFRVTNGTGDLSAPDPSPLGSGPETYYPIEFGSLDEHLTKAWNVRGFRTVSWLAGSLNLPTNLFSSDPVTPTPTPVTIPEFTATMEEIASVSRKKWLQVPADSPRPTRQYVYSSEGLVIDEPTDAVPRPFGWHATGNVNTVAGASYTLPLVLPIEDRPPQYPLGTTEKDAELTRVENVCSVEDATSHGIFFYDLVIRASAFGLLATPLYNSAREKFCGIFYSRFSFYLEDHDPESVPGETVNADSTHGFYGDEDQGPPNLLYTFDSLTSGEGVTLSIEGLGGVTLGPDTEDVDFQPSLSDVIQWGLF